MDEIMDYLLGTYHPLGMIVYGSYANGTNNQNSDFDAVLICDGEVQLHDNSIVNGVELDVFVYPRFAFAEYEIQDFLQIWDGKIIVDQLGILEKLRQEARAYIEDFPRKTPEENAQSIAWCEKMLLRTKRNDMEGLYRLHWLLVDSLEIYYDVRGMYCFGPKKALKQMEQQDAESARLYHEALRQPNDETLSRWIRRLKCICADRETE